MSTMVGTYFATRLPSGRWGVAHHLPGTMVHAVQIDCPTEQAAREEAARLQARQTLAHAALRTDAALRGMRTNPIR